ncbi:hypothetical protein APA_4585 [Pseudanabaena sp. lw0831]|uniref:hypothetical protein n=1 Tax=Pseudanabaena sp. lw0831 TaxID=1357935 RepID=UPI001914DE5C|nr:hypothetical protein [Pseudanabaena sp. lw0831]GBO56255.1 hypothetical protein APA_4585 [Pseudanabaena sp. lw0831]
MFVFDWVRSLCCGEMNLRSLFVDIWLVRSLCFMRGNLRSLFLIFGWWRSIIILRIMLKN